MKSKVKLAALIGTFDSLSSIKKFNLVKITNFRGIKNKTKLSNINALWNEV